MKYEEIDITCPNCGELAKFEEPFEFISNDSVASNETRPCHQWGAWIVVERFPSQVKWKSPRGSSQYLRSGRESEDGGYPLYTNGFINCSSCHANKKHKLTWPDDAFWQWEIKSELLWAWNRQHAQVIFEYIKKTTRPPRYNYYLRYIPSHFLSSNLRERVVKKMEMALNN